MVIFSLASTSSSDKLEPIKSVKCKGWKRREVVKVSGASYLISGKRTLKGWEETEWRVACALLTAPEPQRCLEVGGGR